MESIKGVTIWECRCICSNIKNYAIREILNNGTKSCGCMKGKMISNKKSLPDEECAFRSIYRNTQKRAKRCNHIFEIDKISFKKLIKSNCYYCNRKPSNWLFYNKFKYMHTGLDRVDSSKGYALNNVVPCCKLCNQAKNDLTVKEFKNFIRKLYGYFIKAP